MPSARERFTTNGTSVPEFLSMRIDRGRLKAASVVSQVTTIPSPQVFVTITLEIASKAEHLAICALASGWVGPGSIVGWTGDIEAEPDMRVVVRSVSIATTEVDFATLVEIP